MDGMYDRLHASSGNLLSKRLESGIWFSYCIERPRLTQGTPFSQLSQPAKLQMWHDDIVHL